MNRRNFFKKLAKVTAGLALAPYIGVMGPIPINPNPLYQHDKWRETILLLWPAGRPTPLAQMLEMMDTPPTEPVIHLWDE